MIKPKPLICIYFMLLVLDWTAQLKIRTFTSTTSSIKSLALISDNRLITQSLKTLVVKEFKKGIQAGPSTHLSTTKIKDVGFYVQTIAPVKKTRFLLVGGSSPNVLLFKLALDDSLQLESKISIEESSKKGKRGDRVELIKEIPEKEYHLAASNSQALWKIFYLLPEESTKFLSIEGNLDSVAHLALSPKKYLLAAGRRAQLILADWTTPEKLKIFTLNRLSPPVAALASIHFRDFQKGVSGQNSFIIALQDGSIYNWNAQHQRIDSHLANTTFGYTHKIYDVLHIKNTDYVAVAGSSLLSLINLFNQLEIPKIIEGVGTPTSRLLYHEEKLILGSLGGLVHQIEFGPDEVCHYSCSKCSAGVRHDRCEACKPGFEKPEGKGNRCVPACEKEGCLKGCKKESEFLRYPHVCGRCNEACRAGGCFNGDSNGCLECKTGLFRLLNGNCENSCTVHSFANIKGSFSGRCEACAPSCLKCHNETRCLRCEPGFSLAKNNANICSRDCKIGEIFSQGQKNCVPCSAGCVSCHKIQPEFCLECGQGLTLVNGKCHQGCPKGFAQYELDLKNTGSGVLTSQKACFECEENCESCEAKNFTCSSCSRAYYLEKHSNTCVTTCPAPEKFIKGRLCLECPKNCLKCQDEVGCVQCSRGYILMPGGMICKSRGFAAVWFKYFMTLLGLILIIFAIYWIFYRKSNSEDLKHREVARMDLEVDPVSNLPTEGKEKVYNFRSKRKRLKSRVSKKKVEFEIQNGFGVQQTDESLEDEKESFEFRNGGSEGQFQFSELGKDMSDRDYGLGAKDDIGAYNVGLDF